MSGVVGDAGVSHGAFNSYDSKNAFEPKAYERGLHCMLLGLRY